MKLTLNENDLALIDNALRALTEDNRRLAREAPDTPEGRHLRTAATQSADQYESLADRIQAAEEIEVELS